MDKLIKILHIDSNWQVVYILIRKGALVKTVVSLETAILLLKNQEFDLIVSEPQNLALLDHPKEIEKEIPEDLINWMNLQKTPGPIPEYQTGMYLLS
ncbi:MAG: hypothetical protein WA974_05760 [Thermodesulfobacteriota bacterium]